LRKVVWTRWLEGSSLWPVAAFLTSPRSIGERTPLPESRIETLEYSFREMVWTLFQLVVEESQPSGARLARDSGPL
jgi:hypothetical protein